MQFVFEIGLYFSTSIILNGAGLNQHQDQQDNAQNNQYRSEGYSKYLSDHLLHRFADRHILGLGFLCNAKNRPLSFFPVNEDLTMTRRKYSTNKPFFQTFYAFSSPSRIAQGFIPGTSSLIRRIMAVSGINRNIPGIPQIRCPINTTRMVINGFNFIFPPTTCGRITLASTKWVTRNTTPTATTCPVELVAAVMI